MKIYSCHLLNDYSGSPKVLMQLVKGWVKNNYSVTVVIGEGREGFLSDLQGVSYIKYRYRWAANPWLRLINLTLGQWKLFWKLFSVAHRGDIIYVNTVLPFGAALLGKVKGIRVIYHVHETTMKPAILKKNLFGIMRWTADEVVFVSKYLANQEGIKKQRQHILYNTLEKNFQLEALRNDRRASINGRVLMVCSLKWYKGVDEFVALAARHANYSFRLVVNASQQEVDQYEAGKQLTRNLQLFPVTKNLHPFFQWADVILNLSRPDGWIETFGLTIIEGMAYGLPAIVPPVGGITELVDPGVNGFHADSRDIDQVSDSLTKILSPDTYFNMQANSFEKLRGFNEDVFIKESLQILGVLPDGKALHPMETSFEKVHKTA